MKSLRKRSIPSQADVKSFQLAIKFPAKLKLQQWKPGRNQEAITQYNATIQGIMKLTKLPTPNAWAALTQLPEPQLALLSQNTVTANANNWICPCRPKATAAALSLKLMEQQLFAYKLYYTTLSNYAKEHKCRGRSANPEFRLKILEHAFQWFGHNSGTDAQNMLHQANERGPHADRLELLRLAKKHPWICVAYYSATLYLELIQLFTSDL
jgi:hypothetical protein